MPPRIAQACLTGARSLCGWVATGVLWTLWLVLASLAAFQIYLASIRELELPGFVVREIEARLAATGMHAVFGRTVFDPSGRVLVEDVEVTVASFEEPVLKAKAVYARVDPWTLLAGRFEPLAWKVTGLSLRVPAMLSPSARTEEVVSDLDASFHDNGSEARVDYLNCSIGNLKVSARGGYRLGAVKTGRAAPLPLAEELQRNLNAFTRVFAPEVRRLEAFDDPVLVLRVAPGPTGPAVADIAFLARGLSVSDYQAGPLEASGSLDFTPQGVTPVEVNLAADELRAPGGLRAMGIRARFRGDLAANPLRLDARSVEVAAGDVEILGVPVGAPFATIIPGPLPRLSVEAAGWLLGVPMAAGAGVDLGSKAADVRFDGEIAPAFVDYAASKTGRKLRQFLDPGSPVAVSGGLQLNPGWKLGRISARVAAHGLKVRGVVLDDAYGRVDYDGRHLSAPEAWVRSGGNFARGSYEQDIATRDYRFVLEGRLRPLDISPWFPRWWSALFGNFGFPSATPTASVDLKGRWTDGRRTSAFVRVESEDPVVRGVPFDRVRTLLFLRPTFTDGLGVTLIRGDGTAKATFVRRITPGPAGASQRTEFEAASTLDPREVAGVFGPGAAAAASHLACVRPPALHLKGEFESTKAPGGPGTSAHVEVRSEGVFQWYNWPLDKVAFVADLHGGDLTIDRITATIAGGAANGRVEVTGKAPDRRVTVAAACTGASLGQAVVAAEGYIAQRKGARPVASTAFLNEKANVRFDLNVSATGTYGDPFSYKGGGRASLEGAELGEVRVFGLLSELLRFTSLRFTSARGDFKVDGRQLVFPDVSVTGANSGIEAHGSYSLDRHELDFKAKIYPFKQSKLLPEMLVGAVLSPLSDVFEVKLTGSVANPRWMLAKGPSNLLHNLEQAPSPSPKTAGGTSAASPTR